MKRPSDAIPSLCTRYATDEFCAQQAVYKFDAILSRRAIEEFLSAVVIAGGKIIRKTAETQSNRFEVDGGIIR
jgi:hypothetical protein